MNNEQLKSLASRFDYDNIKSSILTVISDTNFEVKQTDEIWDGYGAEGVPVFKMLDRASSTKMALIKGDMYFLVTAYDRMSTLNYFRRLNSLNNLYGPWFCSTEGPEDDEYLESIENHCSSMNL